MLLCLAIPLQGYALSALPEVYCPMAETMGESGASTATHYHCCDDKAANQKMGKACKADLQCQTCGQHSFYSASSMQMPVLAHPVHFAFAESSPLSFDLSAVWRPPTLF